MKRAGVSPWSARVASFLVVEAISAIGTFATMIAIWAYAAYRYDASAGEISLYGLAFSAPGVLLGPVTGVVIDRIGPRQTLLGAKALGVAASLALLAAHDFRMLTILSALHGVGGAFARPALQSLPPRMVDDEHLARTNALVGLTDQLAIVLGPVAAGVAIGWFGFKGAFVFDAATYALGIVVLPLVQLRPVDAHPSTEPDGASVGLSAWRDAVAGWRIVARTPVARRVVASTFVVFALYGLAMLAEPLYVRDVLERPTSVFAALQTVFGIFLVLGGLVAARVGDRMATFGWVAAGVIGSGATAIVYLSTRSVIIAFVGVSLWGVATAAIWGPSRTVLQRSTPVAAHGRVMSADTLAGNLAMFLGLGLAGVTIGAFGVRTTVLVVGFCVIVAGTALGLLDRVGTFSRVTASTN
ncbi:MAG TPA: MFS transporter [Acidimicrobiales bacterium]|nr:MFS transporter [Acidimicrobiales bacterium]